MKRIVVLLLVMCMLLMGCSGATEEEIREEIGTDKMNVDTYFSEFIINTDELVQVTTYAKYIFVGEVTDYLRTERDKEIEEDADTFYSVRVLENIKGTLTQEEDIEVKKVGGISKDGSCYYICSGDRLPAVGDICVFAAIVSTGDGSIYCYGPNTVSAPLDKDTYKESEVYLDYVEASKEVSDEVPVKEWSASKYEVSE